MVLDIDLVDMLSKTSGKEILPIKEESSRLTTIGTLYAMSVQ